MQTQAKFKIRAILMGGREQTKRELFWSDVFYAILIVGLAVFSLRCAPPIGPTPPPVPVGTTCVDAQTRLDALQCSWRKGSRGTTFKDTCENAAREGIDMAPTCIARASTCDDAKACR